MPMYGRAKRLAAYRLSVNARANSFSSHKKSMLPIAKSVASKEKWASSGAKPVARRGKSMFLLRNRWPEFRKRMKQGVNSKLE